MGIEAMYSSTDLLDLACGYGASNNGRIRSRTDALQPEHSVNYTYDAMNRLKQVSQTAHGESVGRGNVTNDGNEKEFIYNAFNQVLQVKEPNPTLSTPLTTNYAYCVFGPLYYVDQPAPRCGGTKRSPA